MADTRRQYGSGGIFMTAGLAVCACMAAAVGSLAAVLVLPPLPSAGSLDAAIEVGTGSGGVTTMASPGSDHSLGDTPESSPGNGPPGENIGGPMGIGMPPMLDGNLSDFKALVTHIHEKNLRACAMNQIDNIDNGPDAGLDGFQDEPLQDDATPQNRFMHSPINVGNVIFIYIPDSDGVIDPPAEDDSYMAVGINIANGDGDVLEDNATVKLVTPPDLPLNVMVPFDSDGNGDPCLLGQGCDPGDTTPSRWCPSDAALTFDEAIEAMTLSFKLCADSPSDLTSPEFEAATLQRFDQATSLMFMGLDPAHISFFPTLGTTCAEIAARGLDHVTSFPDGLGNDDIEVLIGRIDSQVHALFPGEDFLTRTRFRLANLGLTVRSDATADLSNEDSMFLLCRLDIPELEVTKQIRCVGEDDDAWRTSTQAVAGSVLEFKIEVENTGNVPLFVTLTDVLESLPAAGFILDNNSLTATLFRPTDGLGVDITPLNAADFGLNPVFFTPSPLGFLAGASSGTARELGVLQGVDLCTDPQNPHAGDRLVLTFRAGVTAPDAPCDIPPSEMDIRNSISAMGDPDLPPNPSGNEVFDNAGGAPDTPRERTQGFDDNVVTADVLCRDLTLLKEVRLLPGGTFTTGDDALMIPSADGPIQIEYRYTITNPGEAAQAVTLTDSSVCVDAAGSPDITFIACPLCENPAPGELTTTIAGGGTFQTSCTLQFSNLDALRTFLTRDDNDPQCSSNPSLGDAEDCYRNCASATATASNTGGVCLGGSPITRDSFATICNRMCDLTVTNRVRCILDGCSAPTQFGPFVDSTTDPLPVAPGSCVQYEIEVTNHGDVPICRLRLNDLLGNQPGDISPITGSAQLNVGGSPCPLPPCFNTLGNLCEINPATCPAFPGGQFQPGQTLQIRFNANVPANSDPNPPDPVNTVTVDGAADCPAGGPLYSCTDTDMVELDVRSASLRCDAKQWAFQADVDADCEPEPPFSAFSSSIDLRNQIFPVRLRLRLQATNTGQIPLQATASDSALSNCVTVTPGVDFVSPPACELGTSKLLQPGAQAEWFCELRIDSAAAARALDLCDGAANGVYNNTASVSGTTISGGTGVCVQSTMIAGNPNCSAQIMTPPPCNVTVTKQVKCKTAPDSVYGDTADAVPGTTLTYRVRVENTGTTNIPQVCITDTLGCDEWLVANSTASNIAGVNVGTCVNTVFAASLGTGSRACYSFAACRPAAPWIAAGETLTITFDVLVPANFNQPGQDPDCVNQVTVQAYSENCLPNPPPTGACSSGTDQAQFDVLIPKIDCAKDVCVDLDNDGDCDVGPSTALILPTDTLFPLTVIYRSTVDNLGETGVEGARACDPNVVADALTAGLAFFSCDFCDGACDGAAGDDCADLGALPLGGSGTAECRIQVPTREAWDAFSLTDNDGNEECYRNGIVGQGSISTAGLCANGANTAISTNPCLATLCIPPRPPTGGCCLPNGQCLAETEVDCAAVGGLYNGDGVLCEGDADGNGIDDLCEQTVPTVSTWGLIILTLLLFITAKIRFDERFIITEHSRRGTATLARRQPRRPFVPGVFVRLLGILWFVVGCAASLLNSQGVRISATDLVGASVCSVLAAYLLHLWLIRDPN